MKKAKKKPTAPKQRNNYSLDIKANAFRLYLIGLTLNEISKIVDAPVRTVEKWQIAEKWKSKRETKPVYLKSLELFESGKSYKEIGIILNKSLPTIARYIKHARNESDKE